jgi:hypothetical protein
MDLYIQRIYHETELGMLSLGVHILSRTLNFGSTESESRPQNPVESASRQAADVPSRIQSRELCVQVLGWVHREVKRGDEPGG